MAITRPKRAMVIAEKSLDRNLIHRQRLVGASEGGFRRSLPVLAQREPM